MEETNVSNLEVKLLTEDDIPGAKVQMNDNLVPCNSPRRLCKKKTQSRVPLISKVANRQPLVFNSEQIQSKVLIHHLYMLVYIR